MATNIVKRTFDLLVCIILLPLFLLLLLVFGTLIYIEDRGPVFYKAARIGKDCRIFSMYKFRSMKVGVPNLLNADGSTYNAKDDPRVTRVGRFLRETSLDEVPQILNVLVGDMSLVGPRASGADALPTYQEDELPKMLVRPGITGYTQAYYRNNLSVREKRLKDAWYAQNQSIGLDIKILFATVKTVLRHDNIYTNAEGQLSGAHDAAEVLHAADTETSVPDALTSKAPVPAAETPAAEAVTVPGTDTAAAEVVTVPGTDMAAAEAVTVPGVDAPAAEAAKPALPSAEAPRLQSPAMSVSEPISTGASRGDAS